jgi:hypothetical protein
MTKYLAVRQSTNADDVIVASGDLEFVLSEALRNGAIYDDNAVEALWQNGKPAVLIYDNPHETCLLYESDE